MRGVAGAIIVTCVLALVGCGRGPWALQPVAGHLPDLRFALTDDGWPRGDGTVLSRRRVVLLYFGFTGCSAQCPVTLGRLARILGQMGGAADHVRVLMVSIDPGHDTPEALRRYVGAFDAGHMTGLTGNMAEIAALAKRTRIAWRQDGAGGLATHSNTVYIFDGEGRARLLLTPEDRDNDLIHDLRLLGRP